MTSGREGLGRVVGALLIVQLAGFIVPFVLLLPITAGPEGYLANAAGAAAQIKLAVLLLLANGVLTIGLSASTFPFFRQYSVPMALSLIAAAVVMLLLQAVDNTHILSMLSLSQRYGSAGSPDAATLALATAVGTTRKWAHFTELLAIDSWIFLLYLILFRFAVVPRALAAFGLLCVTLHFVGIPARGFLGLPLITTMGMPMALSHVLIGGRLIARPLVTCMSVLGLALPSTARAQSDSGWSHYGGDAGGMRYSAAAQIDRSNVTRLQVAWTYRTGALDAKTDLIRKAAFEATPILAEKRLYLSTPYNHVIALDPATGTKLWEYDPGVDLSRDYSEVSSRGVSAWLDSNARAGQPCRLRIFLGTLDGRLISLDGENGRLCNQFGERGVVDLNRGAATRTEWTGGYQVTSPPAIAGDLVITGSSIADNWRVDTGRGIVRAFDARTGKLRWTWDPVPWAEKTKPRTGAANAWSTISVDSARDLVFVPTSSPAPDYFGGIRKGDDKWANSVVALRASTGAFVWGFQVVHHDLWDYDVAAQPTLVEWKDGTPAVVVNTKMGHVFVLDRRNGKPLLPVEERAVPRSDIPGEESWPTQPFSTISLVPESFTPEDAWGPTPEDVNACRDVLARSRSEGIFTPPSLRGTVVVPGNVGGVNWGGAAYDPRRHLMFANTNHLVAWVKLIPRARYDAERKKEQDNRIYGEFGDQEPSAYGMYRTFLFSPSKTPCTRPPWGTTVAVDLHSGKKVWETPLGTMIPGKATGSPNLGGPMVTAGGLLFTSATIDPVLRAFDSETGKELWTYDLPAGGQATPMTYIVKGKQYVVIAAGGHGKLGNKQGDYVMAFALP